MKAFRTELHVHTVLSPCAEVEMIPQLIVREALENGIDIIAITDHNSTANIESVQKAAAGKPLFVIPGMELQTLEEVHALCLFDTLEQALQWQDIVSDALPKIDNRPDYFGEQFIVDETGDFIRRENQLLITSARISLKKAWHMVTDLGGMFIPAHVNRKGFGLIPTLGLIPSDIPIEVLEISRHLSKEQAIERYPQLAEFPLIQSGDVHRLNEFLGTTEFFIESPSIEEFRLAAQGIGGRSVNILSTNSLESALPSTSS